MGSLKVVLIVCVFFSKLFEFRLLYPSALSVVPSPCVLVSAVSHPIDRIIPQVFSITCLIISQSLCYLNPSSSLVQSQIVMCFMSFFPAVVCLISWFDPFCVPWPILDSVFCYNLTRCFLTLFLFLTFDFGLSLCFVVSIGLPFGFDPLLVTSFLIWITSVDSVHWNTDPFLDFHSASGLPALHRSAPVRTLFVWPRLS